MPATFCEDNFLPPANADDVCAVMRRLLQLHEFMRMWSKYAIDCETGNLPTQEFALEISAQGFVEGMMIPYKPKSTTYEAVKTEVKNIWGEPNSDGTPWWELATEMEDRFMVGASKDIAPNTTGGENEHTLVEDEIPEHKHQMTFPQAESTKANPLGGRFLYTPHTVAGTANGGASGVGGGEKSVEQWPNCTIDTTKTGKSKSHNNMPQYLAVVWIRRTSRVTK